MIARFLRKVRWTPECWEWLAYVMPNGYGTFRTLGRNEYAHRVSYRLFVGPIPEGWEIHHVCDNRRCVNPHHLKLVTRAEHSRLGNGASARNARKTHCPAGHAYDSPNTHRTPTGQRKCRTCDRDRARLVRARKGER